MPQRRARRALTIALLAALAAGSTAPALGPELLVVVGNRCADLAALHPLAGARCPLAAAPLEALFPWDCAPPEGPGHHCSEPYVAAGTPPIGAVCAPDCGGVAGLNLGGAVFPAWPGVGAIVFGAFVAGDDLFPGPTAGLAICQDLDRDGLCGEPGEPLHFDCAKQTGLQLHRGHPIVVAVFQAGQELVPEGAPYVCHASVGALSAVYAPAP